MIQFPPGHPWSKKDPDPPFDPCGEWITTPLGKFYLTVAYIRGARAALTAATTANPLEYPAINPYGPGPALAQFTWGYRNQKYGAHSNCQQLFLELQETELTF